jgi:hypothetical protein
MTLVSKINSKVRLAELVSDEDRDQAVHSLQKSFLEGCLDEKELEERLALALNARRRSELGLVLADLPVRHLESPIKLASAVAILSNIERRGALLQQKNSRVIAVLGACDLDLSMATFSSSATTINILALLGTAKIIVPQGLRVYVQTAPVVGVVTSKITNDNLPAHAPTLFIHARAILGCIEISVAN